MPELSNMIIQSKQYRRNPVKLRTVFNYLHFSVIQHIYIYAHISAAVLLLMAANLYMFCAKEPVLSQRIKCSTFPTFVQIFVEGMM